MPNPNINRRVVIHNQGGLIPPPINGYAFWFRADGLTAGATNQYGITDGAGSVSQLTDLGGSTITATQSTGSKQPALISSLIGTKTRKGVRFVGANATELIVNNALGLTNNIAGITMYAVSKVNTGGAVAPLIFFSNGTSASASRCDIRNSAANAWQTAGRRLDADSIATVTGNTTTAAYKIIGSPIDYANSNAYIYENGSLVNTNAAFQTDGSTSATNSLSAFIGSVNSANYLTGDIGEILVYIGYHDATQVASIHTWLNNFYGIY